MGLVAVKALNNLLNIMRKTVISGDFNTNPTSSVIGREMSNWNYKQMISYPTHLEGNILDHCYISDNIRPESVKIKQSPVYYTDHDRINIII